MQAKKAHRCAERTVVSYMSVNWTSQPIRFSEAKQLIDVTDVLSVIYKTPEGARVKQSSFLSPSNIHKTAELLNCDQDCVVTKIVWTDAARERSCVSITHMHQLISTIRDIPNAAELVSILDVGKLTVTSAHRFQQPNVSTDVPVDPSGGTEVGTATNFTLTHTDAFKYGNSRLVESTANEWLRTTSVESTARQAVANAQARSEEIKVWLAGYEAQLSLGSHKRKLEEEEVINKMELRIKSLRRLGEENTAALLLKQMLQD